MPTHDSLRHRVGRGEIGLEIDQRRAVEAVEADDRQAVALDAHEPHDARGDRVRPRRRAQREGAAGAARSGECGPTLAGRGVLPTGLPGTILPYKDIFIWLAVVCGLAIFPPPPRPIGKPPTMAPAAHFPFDALHTALKAAGEGTRLRVLALLAEA